MADDPHETARALASGTEAEALAALREVLSEALVNGDGSKDAALSRELRAVIAEERRLGVGREESTVDELSARRARRRGPGRSAPASDPGGAAGG